MQAVLLIGLLGAGKFTFYQQWFTLTNLRLSLDILQTRHRLKLLHEACLAADQQANGSTASSQSPRKQACPNTIANAKAPESTLPLANMDD